MRPYLITTATLFGIATLLHVWRATAEWSSAPPVMAHMVALIVVPAALFVWAVRLLRRPP